MYSCTIDWLGGRLVGADGIMRCACASRFICCWPLGVFTSAAAGVRTLGPLRPAGQDAADGTVDGAALRQPPLAGQAQLQDTRGQQSVRERVEGLGCLIGCTKGGWGVAGKNVML